jgi:hypothetical protein
MVDVTDIMMRLEAIADELAEMTMNILTQAIQDGQTTRPLQEKSLSQARRSVEKALLQLGKSSSSSD